MIDADFSKYTKYISSFIDSDINEWDFKSNSIYCEILEHLSKDKANEYQFELLNRFNSQFNDNKDYLIKLCNINDLIGKPKKFDFYNFTKCSSNNLRYIFHSFLILNYIQECNLNNIDIIEIGGGYGGLCFYLYNLAHLFGINITTYTIFDLDEPLKLQKKYLNILINEVKIINFLNINDFINDNLIKTNSFLISNYAYSELSEELRNKFTNEILNKYTSHGFLTWNWSEYYDNFIENKIITKEREYPLTSSKNQYIRFKP